MDRLDDFDEQEEMGEQAPTHIWLRYATQFTSGERSYTIDIGIPVPLGADAETREQLLREADAGMNQLASYVERRVMQVAQQSGARSSAPSRPASPPIPAPTPVAAPTPISLPVSAPTAQPVERTAGSTGKPQTPAAQTPPAREGTSASPSAPTPVSQATTKKQEAPPATPVANPLPASRPNIGASMPSSPGLPAGTLSLPEFLKYLKEMGLDARGAMNLLKVKSLSGLNLREALEQLQYILMQEGANAAVPGVAPTAQPSSQAARVPTGPQAPAQKQSSSPRPAQGAMESHSPSSPGSANKERANASGTNRPTASVSQPPQTSPSPPTARSTSTPVSTSASSRQGSSASPATVPPATPAARPSPAPTPAASGAKQAAGGSQSSVLNEEKLPYPVPVVFDEEEDDADLEDLFDEDDEEDQEASFGASAGLSAANRGSAEDIVSRLREVGGSSPVSPTRLKVLHNIIDGQLTPEQLQALIRGVWGTASEKRLKSEQAEELISWGKQDEFVTEAEMVLALFEEDGNASSNR